MILLFNVHFSTVFISRDCGILFNCGFLFVCFVEPRDVSTSSRCESSTFLPSYLNTFFVFIYIGQLANYGSQVSLEKLKIPGN